jgi:hypothetical protein
MTVWKQFVISLVSPKKIADFIQVKKRLAIAFISFLLLICLLPSSIMVSVMMNGAYTQFQSFMKSEKVPDFNLKNGILTSNQKKPIVSNFEGGVFVFDTSGSYTKEQAMEKKARVAVLKNELLLVNNGRTQVIEYKDYKDFSLSKSSLNRYIELFGNLKWVIIFLFLFVRFTFTFLLTLLIVSMLAMIGLGLNTSLQQQMGFGRVWVLSAFAITLPTVFDEMLKAIGVILPFSFVLYFFACCIVLFFVLREVSYRSSMD